MRCYENFRPACKTDRADVLRKLIDKYAREDTLCPPVHTTKRVKLDPAEYKRRQLKAQKRWRRKNKKYVRELYKRANQRRKEKLPQMQQEQ